MVTMKVFNITSSLVDEIVFHMENQKENFLINIETGEILHYKEEGVPEEFSELPQWLSADGFRLMDNFVASLKNPVYKRKLKKVLLSGQGVFRKFKDVLSESADIQRLWFSFKRKEMRDRVLEWYNDLRETQGLSGLEYEEEGFDELVGQDFVIVKGEPGDFSAIIEMDRASFYEAYISLPEDAVEDLYEKKRDGLMNEEILEEDSVYVVKSPADECVGFIWLLEYTLGDSYTVLELMQLYTLPGFRGLGLGQRLLNMGLECFNESVAAEFLVSSPHQADWFQKHLSSASYRMETRELALLK